MKTIAAGTKVTTGYYFNLDRWELTYVKSDAALPTGTDRFLKLPLLFVLAAAPVLGLLMVMFLPFIGFALTLGLVTKKLTIAGQQAFYGFAALVQPAMRPGEAYLTGKREPKDPVRSESDTLDSLEREIAARRTHES